MQQSLISDPNYKLCYWLSEHSIHLQFWLNLVLFHFSHSLLTGFRNIIFRRVSYIAREMELPEYPVYCGSFCFLNIVKILICVRSVFVCTWILTLLWTKSCEFEPRSWWVVLDTTLCDKVCQWHADRHEITKILLKVAFGTINPHLFFGHTQEVKNNNGFVFGLTRTYDDLFKIKQSKIYKIKQMIYICILKCAMQYYEFLC